ncbi:V-type ATP synthase subunit D [Halocella sp. SP3-1]|uniref:V-type ATP synthase subunit D n=1 Tax=Halocella sp. SP3-1 TaxID=2382161 RepID=UPI000F75186A|nr:V-type ATP synthase subunit D [Halocella sp. SP3-1]AZO95175.1 V-type ATP synthase subunit D [Halocella sp. SP3-1]MTI60994.1 V-type ATP synthase subunit D [Bacillota bacterium]
MEKLNLSPTKSNLTSIKASLELAQEGYELLDKKRNVLIQEMMKRIDEAREIQSQINDYFFEAYQALQSVDITQGIKTVEEIATGIDFIDNIKIRSYSVMGVEIPEVETLSEEISPHYSFYRTNMALDRAYKNFQRVVSLIARLAEIETSVYRLATSIKKTQKRANALDNILIPRYKNTVKFIQDTLEEKEREDFYRVKMLKGNL